jgi:S-DNA-T family DNA segregation ATPase FtsK/SpoIIIE
MIEGIKLLALDIIRGFIGLAIVLFGMMYYLHQGDVLSHINTYWLFLGISTGIVMFIYLGWYIRYWKYIVMPYSLKLISQPKAESKETSVFVDRFVKYDKKSNILYYKNHNAINVQQYQDKKDEILHFLNLHENKSVEIEIQPYKRKWVKIEKFTLPSNAYFQYDYLQTGYMFYGHSKDGRYYTPIDDLTHSICVGESGSGKSNLMNLQIYSLLHNMDYIEYLIFVDLKGVELSRYKVPKSLFIDNIQDVDTLFDELKTVMYQRFKEMQSKGDILYDGKPIFCIIDEVGTIGTAHDKKLRDTIFNNMIEIFQKGRACKIILLFYSQKIDSTNIPSNVLANIQTKILMKTDSDFNINNTIGLKEDIELITRFKVADFPKGRAIIKDGITSNKTLIQVPYLHKNLQDSMIKYFARTIQ